MPSTTVPSPTKAMSPKKFSTPTKAIRLIQASSPTKKAMSPRKVRFPRRTVPGKSCLKKESSYSPAKKNVLSSPSKARSPKPATKNVAFATPSKVKRFIIPAENRGRRIKQPHTSVRLLSPEKQPSRDLEAQIELAKVRTSATKKLKAVLKMFRSWKQAGAANEKRMFEIYEHLNRLGKSCTKEELSLLRKPVQGIILEMEKLEKEEKEFLKLVELAKVQKQAKEKSIQQPASVDKEKPNSIKQRRNKEEELVKGLTKELKAVTIGKGEQPATQEKNRDEHSRRTPAEVEERRNAPEPKTRTKIPAQPKRPSPPKIATTDAQVDDEASLRTLMAAEQSRKASPSATRANAAAETKHSSPSETAVKIPKAHDADEDDGRPKWWHPIFFLVMLILIWGLRHD